ncbi:acyltransferase family protein [Sanguibacter sp. HDW7]|uniref:acyltransferase family protein n=1 Tax=Sanguibacter sp. HDW7 TaxID=2714931 RepID=UPI00140911BD|nr:acyltransferase family protein [Sanguibacter sp. HDW7]QIK83555.1 acetyltransferase [Sanguibacter sp. HDW7]
MTARTTDPTIEDAAGTTQDVDAAASPNPLAWTAADSPVQRRPTPRRIAGIDGLRAVAVLLVLAFHLAPDDVPGGFVGVDVFFVISGFLITMGLLREKARNGRVDLARFWVKRARRLLPALLVVVAVCSPVALAVGGDVRVHLDRQVFGAMTFSSNWVSIAADDSYFSALVPQIFSNLWSLAVEEQFYLVWPFVVVGVLLLARSRRAGLLAAGGAALVSAAAMALLYSPGEDPTRVYYGTDTHVFGMMLGALLAFWYFGNVRTGRPAPWPAAIAPVGRGARLVRALKRRRPGVVAMVCLAVIGAFALLVPWDSPVTYRGGLLVLSLAAALLVTTMLHESRVRRVLETPALRWIGERSYGVYLWHWPVFVLLTQIFAKQYVEGSGIPLVWVVTVVVTFLLAGLSYRFIEQPVLRDGVLVSLERLARWARPVREAPGRGLRAPVLGGAVAACLVLTGFAVATAPHVSSIEQDIEAGIELNGPGLDPAVPVAPTEGGATAPGSGGSPDAGAGSTPTGTPGARPSKRPGGTPGKEPAQDPAGTAGATPTPDPTTPPPPATGSDLVIVGDSVTAASAKQIRGLLPDARIDAAVSRSMLVAPGILSQLEKKGALPDVVVLALATNTTLRERTIDDVLAAVGPERHVVLVNAYGARSWIKGTNAVIDEAAKKHPQVSVADWHDAVRSHGELLAADGIHPTRDGAEVYARLLVDAYAAARG